MNQIEKIVIVANNIGGLGGVSTFVRTMAREFTRRGYEVLLLGFDQVDAEVDLSEFTSFTAFDAPTPETVDPRTRVLGKADPAVIASHRRLEKLRGRGRERLKMVLPEFDARTAVICTQVFGMERLLDAGFDPGNRNGPLTFGQHHSSFQAARVGGYVRRMLEAYKDIDRFVALTEADARDFQLAGIPSVSTIANPLDMPEVIPDPRSRTVTTVARIHKVKRIDRMLFAWSQVCQSFPDWNLEIWGSGPEEESVARLIAELGLGSSAFLMGPTSNVPDVLAHSALTVLSSDEEGLPLSIVEAARAGLPTVSVDCAPGIRELIDDGITGIVTPPRSVEGLAAGLRALMDDDHARRTMGAAAQQKARQWSPAAIGDRWEEEFERALR
ncbi:glycosyltransferase [Brevibacterium luteolum]|uniref:glycosyltransferase n=1 Tax=Brevibacterium luteolum TaxID=199591 RepID=UPI00223B41FB|nr:glycosyltransferase [Brevibacterium luteolum]MCT1874224.1 glycosyltransferase [Brevibacterium luteolum]MCT1891449.1 glycosyltransferase [Brevibacterium luteolum]MCT1893313.1 glycosyltransferase [Brevibacterium luteolum]MCT1924821.1 glycosyltransferase [Brevibacterium luteolum]